MKKITAMLTTIALLMGVICQSAVFAAFSDVSDDNPYRKAITTLSKLSVIDGYEENGLTSFKPDNPVTRAEFTKLIVFLLGVQNQSYSSYDFEDASDHWAKNYIQTAYNLGIIAGFDDGLFRPEDPVTYEQALKMIVCTLGYESFAQGLGGWPTGYTQQAGDMGLDKNISNMLYSAGAPRGVIAQALYNALEIEMYEGDGYSHVKTNKTLLKDYLKVKELKGTVVGVEDTVTADCSVSLLEGEMDIKSSDGTEYVITYTTLTDKVSDISKYLGNTITVFYRQVNENDERTLIIIDDESNKNSVYDLKYNDIESISGNILKYYGDNSRTKTLKLREKDLTVRYNGKLVEENNLISVKNKADGTEVSVTRDEALGLWLNPDTDYSIYGTVKLTDSSNNGTIDVVQIYDYQTIVAYSAPSTSDYRVTDKLVTGNSLPLDPQASNYTYTITKNNAEIQATNIAANDVILYAESLDESFYTLLVSNQSIKGTISSVNSSSEKITINGTSYNVSDKCKKYVQEKSGKELKTGVSGTFYLDALQTIVFATIEQTAVVPYAYISNAIVDETEGDKAYITVYSASTSGGAVTYPVKERVKFNGSNVSSSTIVDKLSQSASYTNGDADMADKIYGAGKNVQNIEYAQPARVTIKDGNVTEIITMESDEIQSQNDDKEKIVKGKELGQYKYASNGFTTSDNKTAFNVNSSTMVICPPSDRSQKNKYARKTASSAFTTGDYYYVEAYDISSSRIAGLVILYGNDGSLTKVKKDTDFSVVSALPEGTYDEGSDKAVLELSVFAGTSSKKWTTYDDTEFADVEVGDVIQFAYDSDQFIQGRINNIRYRDIEQVLKSGTFDWNEKQTPSEENNYQEYKFDYRFKKTGTSSDEIYTSSSIGEVPYSRACMYNVSQVLLDDNKLYVTKNGFDENGDIDDDDYEEITITSSTKIVRYDEAEEEITQYAPDTTANMTINDLKDAKNYGINCSKILVCTLKNAVRLIVVYQ